MNDSSFNVRLLELWSDHIRSSDLFKSVFLSGMMLTVNNCIAYLPVNAQKEQQELNNE